MLWVAALPVVSGAARGSTETACYVRLLKLRPVLWLLVRLVPWAARGCLSCSAGWLVASLILASPPLPCRAVDGATLAEDLLGDKSCRAENTEGKDSRLTIQKIRLADMSACLLIATLLHLWAIDTLNLLNDEDGALRDRRS